MATLIAYLRLLGARPGDRHGPAGYQRDAVLGWARRRRHEVTAFVEEDDLAGLDWRPGLAAAVAGLSDDGIDGLVVTSLTSLSEDLVAQEQLLAEIRRTGAKVYSLDRPGAARGVGLGAFTAFHDEIFRPRTTPRRAGRPRRSARL
jgi:hypothetical protein